MTIKAQTGPGAEGQTLPEQSESREGLVDWPDGQDWTCQNCGATVTDDEVEEHPCESDLTRVHRAYFWPGGRRDVVVQYAYAGEDWED